MNSALHEALQKLVHWVQFDLLTLWRQMGVDTQHGCAYSFLDEHGNPDSHAPISVAAQAQLAYVLARAEQLGWLSGTRTTVRGMVNFAGRHGTLPCRSDGYVRLLDRQLSIVDERHDLTDHALFMSASVAAHVAFGDGSDLRRALNILEWLDLRLSHPDGGWFENTQQLPQRTSLSHLHMLLAFLYLFEITKKPQWLDRAASLLQLYETKLRSQSVPWVMPSYDLTWMATVTDHWNSEEQFLWVYGIQKFSRCSGQSTSATSLYQALLCSPAAVANGLYYEQVALNNKRDFSRALPTSALTAGMHASLSLAALGDSVAEAKLEQQIATFFRECVLREVPGTFVESVTAAGDKNTRSSVGTAYLLFEVARDAAKFLRADGVQLLRA